MAFTMIVEAFCIYISSCTIHTFKRYNSCCPGFYICIKRFWRSGFSRHRFSGIAFFIGVYVNSPISALYGNCRSCMGSRSVRLVFIF